MISIAPSRGEQWDRLSECARTTLQQLGLVEFNDYRLLGQDSTSFFVTVALTDFNSFSVALITALHRCLLVGRSPWGILVSGPTPVGHTDVLAAIYDVAIAEGCDDAVVNEIVLGANQVCCRSDT